jgi:hypothetical protein
MADSTESPPYFDAQAAFVCKANRRYRIYVCPDELIFIWAGHGVVAANHAGAAVHGGLIGVLLYALIAKATDPSKKNAVRQAVLDEAKLEDLVHDDARNLRALLDDFTEVRISPRSEWHAGQYSDPAHKALLTLRHRTLGKYRLGIASNQDVEVALRELPRVFGERCRVEIEWSEEKEKFVKRTSAN